MMLILCSILNNATLVPENALFRFKQNVQTQPHVTGLSLYRCFLFACTFHWFILKIDLELLLKGLVYVLRQNFLLGASFEEVAWPTLSCLNNNLADPESSGSFSAVGRLERL